MFKILRTPKVLFFKNESASFLNDLESFGVSKVKKIGLGSHGRVQKSESREIQKPMSTNQGVLCAEIVELPIL